MRALTQKMTHSSPLLLFCPLRPNLAARRAFYPLFWMLWIFLAGPIFRRLVFRLPVLLLKWRTEFSACRKKQLDLSGRPGLILVLISLPFFRPSGITASELNRRTCRRSNKGMPRFPFSLTVSPDAFASLLASLGEARRKGYFFRQMA